jgi:hypothetical protein
MKIDRDKLSLLIYFFILFLSYETFVVCSFVLIFFSLIHNKNLNPVLKPSVSKFLLFFFYISKFLSAVFNFDLFWKASSLRSYHTDAKFLDMQAFLLPIKCNAIAISDKIKIIGLNEYFNCSLKSNYGPIDQFFAFDLNLRLFTFLFSIILIVLFLKVSFDLINKNEEYVLMVTIVLLSPPINFLIQRMNVDLFIFLVIYFAYKHLFQKKFIFFSILIFVSLLKIYVLFIFVGYIIFNTLTKKYKKTIGDLIAAFISFLIYLYFGYFELGSNFNVRPFRPDRSYGLLTELIKLENLGFTSLYIIFSIIFIIYLCYLFINQNNLFLDNNLFLSSEAWPVLFIFIGTCFYANYDYRIAILVFVPQVFVKSQKNFLFVFLIFLYSHPSILHGYNESFVFVENYFIYFLDIVFLVFFHFVFKDMILYLKNEINSER